MSWMVTLNKYAFLLSSSILMPYVVQDRGHEMAPPTMDWSCPTPINNQDNSREICPQISPILTFLQLKVSSQLILGYGKLILKAKQHMTPAVSSTRPLFFTLVFLPQEFWQQQL